MIIRDNYICVGQMDLFDFIEADKTQFCWDEDINEIVKQLNELAEHYGLAVGEKEFKVWEHALRFGARLWLDIRGTRAELFREDFQKDIAELVEHAKSRNVALTPLWGACWFHTDDENEIGRLTFTTMFMDKARQKRW